MREILFRGKRLDNGEWVVGMLGQYHEGIKATIVLNHFGAVDSIDFICVDPSTAGQYTGLLDKNGKRIFEGDVVCCAWYNDLGVIEWSADTAKFSIMFDGPGTPVLIDFDQVWGHDCEVIGNIHDNPELLGGGGADD